MSEWDKTIEKIRILEAERTKLLEENKQLEYETYLNREIFWAHMVDVDKKLETMTLKYKGMDSINQFNITEADKEHQKLEAIRTKWKEKPDETMYGYDHNEHHTAIPNPNYEDWLEEWKEVLGE